MPCDRRPGESFRRLCVNGVQGHVRIRNHRCGSHGPTAGVVHASGREKSMSRNFRIAGGLAVLLTLLAAPLAVGNYGYYILAIVMIYAMVALSLNILIG